MRFDSTEGSGEAIEEGGSRVASLLRIHDNSKFISFRKQAAIERNRPLPAKNASPVGSPILQSLTDFLFITQLTVYFYASSNLV